MKYLSLAGLCWIQLCSYVYAQAVDVSPPVAYASDDWVIKGNSTWQEEVVRRESELKAYLEDSDPERALKYGFRTGQNPALAWNWFDQEPIGFGGMPYVILQTLLSLDPATETDPELLKLANIWKKKSVIPDEQANNVYTLDHIGMGPSARDYVNGVVVSPEQRQYKLPNGLAYDSSVEPESVYLLNLRLRFMRDGYVGALIRLFYKDYNPTTEELLELAVDSIRHKFQNHEINYESDVALMQEPPKTDAVFFACSSCHVGRVIVDGQIDSAGNIVKAGKMKFLPGMPNTEIEAQYYSKLLMETGLALLKSGFSVDATELPKNQKSLVPSKKAIVALYRRMLTRAIDPETVGSIYGDSPKQIERARLQTFWVARDFPSYAQDLISVAIKTQYIYYQVAKKYAFNPDNPRKQYPEQPVPNVIENRIGQMDAFGIASGLVSLHTLRKDNSYVKFMHKDNPDNPIFTGINSVNGFSGAVDVAQAGPRIRDTIAAWAPPVPAPVDIKSLSWSGDRKLANWDGNQGSAARTLASGTSATGDPIKVNTRIHEPLNPLIDNMPPPPYPFAVDRERALTGKAIFNGFELAAGEKCSGCHKPHSARIFSVNKLGVDPNRSILNTEVSRWGLAALVMESCRIFMRKNPGNDWCMPRDEKGNVITDINAAYDDYFKDTPKRDQEGTNGYKADMLHGIWARAPYLHNGSVPTLAQLLCSDTRPEKFKRGILFYDQELMGFEWANTPKQRYSQYEVQLVKTYDTNQFGRANKGHYYGRSLCPDTTGLDPIEDRAEITQRIKSSKIGDLLEYLKTL